MNRQIEKRIPILSFFAGGGFLDMGFEQAGFDLVWANEFDEDFVKLNKAGMTSWKVSAGVKHKLCVYNLESISDLTSKIIIKEAFPKVKPKVFGVIGGPPCQDFSINGKSKGFNGERGKLTSAYCDKVLELKPTFFLMENVTGLVNGSKHKLHFESLLNRVSEKYYIDSIILNAINYGVPQSRQRFFLVGVNKRAVKKSFKHLFLKENWFSWPKNEKYENSLKKYSWPKTNIFGIDPPIPSNIPLELCVTSCLISKKNLPNIPNSEEYFPLRKDPKRLTGIEEGNTNRPSFKRLHRYRYSPTACYGNNEVHLHPFENRRISVREALRIQGVPDTYILPRNLSKTKKFKMIGNGVPVPLANAVAVSLKAFLCRSGIF